MHDDDMVERGNKYISEIEQLPIFGANKFLASKINEVIKSFTMMQINLMDIHQELSRLSIKVENIRLTSNKKGVKNNRHANS
jgi:hypothetical protein